MYSHAEGEGECLCNNLLRAVRYAKGNITHVSTSKLVATRIMPPFLPCTKAEYFSKAIPYGEFIAAPTKACSFV